MNPKVASKVSPLHGRDVNLTGGILAARYQANFENLFGKIEAREYFTEVYGKTHDMWFAEPEFCGHYLDAAMEFYDAHQDESLLELAGELVDIILRNQREDGYLGVRERGKEFGKTFGVWNQQFTMMGLLSYYERTGYQPALEGAAKCGDYIANWFIAEEGKSLLKCVNAGIQHSCIFIEYVRLLRHTGKPLYREFLELIMRRWDESNLRLIAVADPDVMPMFEVGCQKGIEMLVCYQGIAELYRLTGNETYLQACENYWKFLDEWQVGLTGNGSVGELWNPARKGFRHVSTDVLPNENCVAVGWMMLSILLFELTGKKQYIDAFERTLYNHLLGAQAIDGTDFSYYQGTYGCKLHAKREGEYSCCRFRGMRILAKLPKYAVMKNDSSLFVNLYTPCEVQTDLGGTTVKLVQQTTHPRSGYMKISMELPNPADFALKLRVPAWCSDLEVKVDGEVQRVMFEDGFVALRREWPAGTTSIEVNLDMALRENRETVDHRPALAMEYGPLLLALDSRFHSVDGAWVAVPPASVENKTPSSEWQPGEPVVEFEVDGQIREKPARLHYIDYASAGSQNPGVDRFTVWTPVVEA